MFQHPFTVKGRIRRLEYGITSVFCFIVQFIAQLAAAALDAPFLIALPFLATTYLNITQGAKRCHDRGNSGWFMLIPFYGLWMLFADGEPGANQYGPNPKEVPALRNDSTILDSDYV